VKKPFPFDSAAIDRASIADAEFFDRNPDCDHRVRFAEPGEWPAEFTHTLVVQVRPGFRMRTALRDWEVDGEEFTPPRAVVVH
jgi:hypothetical protein